MCRRKIASRGQPIVTQESTDSLLEVPVLEALQRRHSDARLSCQSGGPNAGAGSALAPPRSPELRRHSDVSPASLKELEKVHEYSYFIQRISCVLDNICCRCCYCRLMFVLLCLFTERQTPKIVEASKWSSVNLILPNCQFKTINL